MTAKFPHTPGRPARHGRFGETWRTASERHRSHHHRRWANRTALSSIIIALYLAATTLAAAAGVRVLHERSASSVARGASTPPTYLVLVVLDGARPDYFDLTTLPHLDALRAAGTQFTNAFDGILEAETPSGHATIATGSRPNRNGLLGFDWTNDSGRYSLFSPDQMGALEQILQDARAPTLAGLYKKKYPRARVVALSGHKYYAAAPLGGPDADAIMYYQGDPQGRYVPVAVPGHLPPARVLTSSTLVAPTTRLPDGREDHLATELALSAVKIMHPRLLLINYPEFDWPLGHVDGGILDRAKVIKDMQVFDSDLGRIESSYLKAGILDKTLFVVTADHGMMPITHFVPSTVVTNAVTQAGTTAPDIAASSADYVWLADGSKAAAVAENIVKAHEPGIQSVYSLAEKGGEPQYISADPTSLDANTEAANQYLLGALFNGHQPNVVVFGREGVSFSDPKTGWKADHGGNSWESQHIPLIFSGPGIRAGAVSDAPVQLEDVAPTVLTDMGVTPRGMGGHILTDAVLKSTGTAQRARETEIDELEPFTGALSTHSAEDAVR